MSVFILGSYAKALVMTTDRIPLAGETLIGYDFRQTWGGKGSDMAVQAVRLGGINTLVNEESPTGYRDCRSGKVTKP